MIGKYKQLNKIGTIFGPITAGLNAEGLTAIHKVETFVWICCLINLTRQCLETTIK